MTDVRCMAAFAKRPHLPHRWEPQEGMEFVRCPGVPYNGEEPKAQVEGRVLGLTIDEVFLLHAAYEAAEQLNYLLEQRNSPHRWRVLGNSDPRRTKRKGTET